MFFKNIIGQKESCRRLLQSVKDGFIPHARLITGGEGAGAFPLALAYARYLHCTNRGEKDACGECPGCHKIDKLSHPDLHFVFPVINKKGKTNTVCDDFLAQWREFVGKNPYFNLSSWLEYISAENAQGTIYSVEADEITRKLNLKAYESEYKIMIVWLPEKMHEVAANKLLKLLEEPPAKTIFLLVSEEPDKIIGTIQSRAQRFPVSPIAQEDLKEVITAKYNLPDEEAALIAHLSNGNYLNAIRIINTTEETEHYLELFKSIMRNAWKRDIVGIKAKTDEFAALGRDKQKGFLAYAQKYIRENFFYRLQIPEINYMNRTETEFSKKFSSYINERNIIDFMDELALAERHIEQNVNPRMVFFDLSTKIAVLLKK
ncbi:MAG: DNA polymerase III subunit delta' [Dysgonamonadaceae bacterium]|jgi:DNA polymerase-3 subunit delta'|nr:DNA polymerase III subunit delta' [Dysgonamonadaceae bacterium]